MAKAQETARRTRATVRAMRTLILVTGNLLENGDH
jgi:hypothetical protein